MSSHTFSAQIGLRIYLWASGRSWGRADACCRIEGESPIAWGTESIECAESLAVIAGHDTIQVDIVIGPFHASHANTLDGLGTVRCHSHINSISHAAPLSQSISIVALQTEDLSEVKILAIWVHLYATACTAEVVAGWAVETTSVGIELVAVEVIGQFVGIQWTDSVLEGKATVAGSACSGGQIECFTERIDLDTDSVEVEVVSTGTICTDVVDEGLAVDVGSPHLDHAAGINQNIAIEAVEANTIELAEWFAARVSQNADSHSVHEVVIGAFDAAATVELITTDHNSWGSHDWAGLVDQLVPWVTSKALDLLEIEGLAQRISQDTQSWAEVETSGTLVADLVGGVGTVGILGPGILDADDFEQDEAFIATGAIAFSCIVGLAGIADWLADAVCIFEETVGALEAGGSISGQIFAPEISSDDLRAGQDNQHAHKHSWHKTPHKLNYMALENDWFN